MERARHGGARPRTPRHAPGAATARRKAGSPAHHGGGSLPRGERSRLSREQGTDQAHGDALWSAGDLVRVSLLRHARDVEHRGGAAGAPCGRADPGRCWLRRARTADPGSGYRPPLERPSGDAGHGSVDRGQGSARAFAGYPGLSPDWRRLRRTGLGPEALAIRAAARQRAGGWYWARVAIPEPNLPKCSWNRTGSLCAS